MSKWHVGGLSSASSTVPTPGTIILCRRLVSLRAVFTSKERMVSLRAVFTSKEKMVSLRAVFTSKEFKMVSLRAVFTSNERMVKDLTSPSFQIMGKWSVYFLVLEYLLPEGQGRQ